jgi:hypothetical protein
MMMDHRYRRGWFRSRGLGSLIWLFIFLSCSLLTPDFGLAEQTSCQIISPQKNLKSQQDSTQPIEVTISNAGEETMNVYWIDYTGKENYIDSLNQGDSATFSTFPGHVWRTNFDTSGKTNFEKVISVADQNNILTVGSGCKAIDLGLNFTEYLFKTTSDLDLVPDPPLVLQQISRSPCQSIGLTDWINKYVIAPGYHVVCLTRQSSDAAVDGSWRISIEGWRDGYLAVNQNSGQTFTGSR